MRSDWHASLGTAQRSIKSGLAMLWREIARRPWFMALLVFILAGLTYSTAGFRNTLIRDAGGYLYIGQQVLKGVPPYVSMFTHKGPVAPFFVALGVALSQPLGLPDILAARMLFCIIGCSTAAALYLLIAQLTRSPRAGVLGALLFLACYPFTFGATAGPEPKLPMLLFVVLNVYLASRRRWFWAGFTGCLAAFTWQPTAVFPAITLLLAILQPAPARRCAVLGVLAGGFIPASAITGYFIERDALPAFVHRFLLFNVTQLNRSVPSLLAHVRLPYEVITRDYRTVLAPLGLGLVGLAGIYIRQAQNYHSWRDLRDDPYALLLLSFPLPILWSLKDFQAATDFYVFLPYLALGFGWLAAETLGQLGVANRPAWVQGALFVSICLALLGLTVFDNRARQNWDLDSHLRAAQRVVERFGPDVRVLARGRPYVLALLGKASPTPIMNCNYVFDLEMERFPGGYAAWMAQIEAFDPQIIALGKATGKYAEPFIAWMNERYVVQRFSPWKLYVKRELVTGEMAAPPASDSAPQQEE